MPYFYVVFILFIYMILFFFFFACEFLLEPSVSKLQSRLCTTLAYCTAGLLVFFFFFFFALTLESPLFLSSNSSPVLCMLNLVLDCCKDFIDSRTNRKKSQICKDISNFNAISSVQFSRSVMSNSL